MKRIKISSRDKEMYTFVDDADYEMVSKYRWFVNPQGYVWAGDYSGGWRNRKALLMHRLLMATPVGQTVDHIDHNPLNNQRANLRLASYAQNNMNTRLRSDNTSGHRGVYWESRRNCWRVCINFEHKQIHVGQFKDKQEAITAYDNKAKQLYGQFVLGTV